MRINVQTSGAKIDCDPRRRRNDGRAYFQY